MSEPDRTVSGDSDAWMLFARATPDGIPLVVIARTGNPLVDELTANGLVSVVECRPDSGLINDRGMPQHTDRIYPVQDGLADALAGTGALHMAAITGNGLRQIVYVHPEPIDFASMLRGFDVPEYSLSAAQAEDLASLIATITPTEVDRQLSGDGEVIGQLEKSGDTLSTPRKVDFWIYGDHSALSKLVGEIASHGFEIDHWLVEEGGVVLTKELAPNFDTFREITPFLVAIADRHGVTYDGWETFVVRPGLETPLEPKPQSLLSKLFGAKKN